MLIMCERGLIQEKPDINKDKTYCFFGHRKIDETAELKDKLCGIIENLIVNKKLILSSSAAKVNLMIYAIKPLPS